jgi:polyphosphate glucokinase
LITLVFDVGGSGLKATVLDDDGTMLADRVRVETAYPMPPDALIDALAGLATQLPKADRASVGFPGMVRGGRVLTAPHFVTAHGPGTDADPKLLEAWTGFDLISALQARIGVPVRLANDADVQGSAVVSGDGLEMVITLGTGFGTSLFENGRLLPHFEFAHHPFQHGMTYDEYLGDAERKELGNKRWSRRVKKAVDALDALVFFDRIYVGGGNSEKVEVDLGPKAIKVDNRAGLLGGVKLWERG